LVFLFELLAGAKPLGKKKVREAVFGRDWSAVTGGHRRWPTTAILLARLTSDSHVNWDHDTQTSAVDRCLAVVAEYHREDNGTDLYEATPAILRPLFSGEPAIVRERLQRLADRWASMSIPRLSLAWTPVVDLSPLATLDRLRDLHLLNTLVVDLSPLAELTELTMLRLDKTRVVDLSPLAGLTKLRDLDLSDTPVVDLSPLARLTGLTTLRLHNTEVISDEVSKLKAHLPGLQVHV
jgi:hypothetical protein